MRRHSYILFLFLLSFWGAAQEVEVYLSVTKSATSRVESYSKPASLEKVTSTASFYVDIWMHVTEGVTSGITAAYFNLNASPSELVLAENITHSSLYNTIPRGTFEDTHIADFGGCLKPDDTATRGVNSWVRLGSVQLLPQANGIVEFSVTAGDSDGYCLEGATEVSRTIKSASAVLEINISTGPLVAAPVFSPVSGSIVQPDQTISITSATQGASVAYRIGTGELQVYTEPFKIPGDCTVTAYAAKAGMSSSSATATYTAPKQAVAPVFSPESGTTFTQNLPVTISCSTDNAKITYWEGSSTDTEAPASAITAASPVTVSLVANEQSSRTLCAYATVTGGLQSDISYATYSTQAVVAVPSILPSSTDFNTSVSVSLSCATEGAEIYYTLNGAAPVRSESTTCFRYTAPFTLTGYTQVIAKAFKDNYIASDNASKTYSRVDPLPVPEHIVKYKNGNVAPAAADFSYSFNDSCTLVLTPTEADTSIYYTLDDTDPEIGNSKTFLYSLPITTEVTRNIKVIQHAEHRVDSEVLTVKLTRSNVLDPPEFSPVSGTELTTSSISVTVTANEGATIYYTTDGSTPSSSGTAYTDAFTLTVPDTTVDLHIFTVKAIACVTDMEPSEIATATYTWKKSYTAPVIAPASGITFTADYQPEFKISVPSDISLSQDVLLYYAIGDDPASPPTDLSTFKTVASGSLPYIIPATEIQNVAGEKIVIAAVWGKDGKTLSSYSTASYTRVSKYEAPVITPAKGTFTETSPAISISTTQTLPATVQLYYSILAPDENFDFSQASVYSGALPFAVPAFTEDKVVYAAFGSDFYQLSGSTSASFEKVEIKDALISTDGYETYTVTFQDGEPDSKEITYKAVLASDKTKELASGTAASSPFTISMADMLAAAGTAQAEMFQSGISVTITVKAKYGTAEHSNSSTLLCYPKLDAPGFDRTSPHAFKSTDETKNVKVETSLAYSLSKTIYTFITTDGTVPSVKNYQIRRGPFEKTDSHTVDLTDSSVDAGAGTIRAINVLYGGTIAEEGPSATSTPVVESTISTLRFHEDTLPPPPAILPEIPYFAENISVTIRQTGTESSSYTIQYTLDGTDPASSATARTYTAPFTITESTLVRAVTMDGTLASPETKVDFIGADDWKAPVEQYGMQVIAQLYWDGVRITTPASKAIVLNQNGEVRGSGEIVTDDNANLFFLTLSSPLQSESELTVLFAIPGADTLVSAEKALAFAAESSLGSIENPLVLSVATQISLELTFGGQKWTWFSMNCTQADSKVGAVLGTEASLFTLGDKVSNSTSFTSWNPATGKWVPSSFTIDEAKTYTIYRGKSEDYTVTYQGAAVAENTSIPLQAGWNWPGYIGRSIAAVSVLHHSAGFASGDIITNGTSFATYYGSKWIPSSFTLVPGQGYKMKCANAGNLTFQFEATRSGQTREPVAERTRSGKPAEWVERTCSNTIMYAYLQATIDGKTLATEGACAAAYINGVYANCTQLITEDELNVFQLQFSPEDETGTNTVTFQVYDPETGKVYELEGSHAFVNNGSLGTIMEPLVKAAVVPGNRPDWTPAAGEENTQCVNGKVLQGTEAIVAPGSLLAVFDAQGLCRGVAELCVEDGLNPYFALTINAGDAQNMTAKVYDAGQDAVLSIAETIHFQSDTPLGTPEVPAVFHVLQSTTITLQIALGRNYNWISFSCLPDKTDPASVFTNIGLKPGDIVNTQTEQATLLNDGVTWSPASFRLKTGNMYLLYRQDSGDATLTVTGQAMNPAAELPVVAGCNWLGFPGKEAIQLASLKHSAGFTDGDFITDGQTSAEYTDFQDGKGAHWVIPEGFMLTPGKGYKLVCSKEGYITVDWDSMTRTDTSIEASESGFGRPSGWQQPSGRRNAMTRWIAIDGLAESSLEKATLAVFREEGEILGIGRYLPDAHCFALTLGADETSLDNLSAFLFNAEDGWTYRLQGVMRSEVTLHFLADSSPESPASPLVLATSGVTSEHAEDISSPQIRLQHGWNLLSTPFDAPVSSVEMKQVFVLEDGNYVAVPLKDLQAGQAFWYFHNGEGKCLTLTGERKRSNIPAAAGWNLMGTTELKADGEGWRYADGVFVPVTSITVGQGIWKME